MKTTRRRALLAAGALAVTALLGGCASIPTDGPVRRVAASGEPSASSQYVINASGPVSGASAEEIVRGFIAAGADVRESYATARKYLTAAAGARRAGGGESQRRRTRPAPSTATGSTRTRMPLSRSRSASNRLPGSGASTRSPSGR